MKSSESAGPAIRMAGDGIFFRLCGLQALESMAERGGFVHLSDQKNS